MSTFEHPSHPIVRVKICGMRCASDINRAVVAGADAVGFIVGVPNDSDDALSAADARRLSELVPPCVTRVLVTHHHDPGTVDALADEIGVDEVQTPACVLCRQGATTRRCTRPRSTGVVYIDGDTAEDRAMEIAPLYDAVHLDSQVSRRRGGTGVTHDWSISKRASPNGSPGP